MKKNIFNLCFVLLLAAQLQAQTEEIITMSRWRLGVELGTDVLFFFFNKPSRIRENHSSHYYHYDDYDYYGGFIYEGQTMNVFYFGVKPEYAISKRFTVSAGIRFSFSQIVYDSDREYFLWKISESEDGTNTNYLKIKDITQRNYYLGIPMEMKIFPSKGDWFVRHYFILGTVFNFLVASTDAVSFKNSAMNKYAPEVLDQIDRLSAFHGCIYLGTGLKIGKTNHPFGNIEFRIPIMLAKDNPNALVKINGAAGIGIQTTLQIPIFAKHQLTYIND
jgi:hypothetical protein